MEVNTKNDKLEQIINQKSSVKPQRLFEDNLFPSTKESLNSYISQLKIVETTDKKLNISWKRLSEIIPIGKMNIIKFDEKDPSKSKIANDVVTQNVQNYEFLALLDLFAKHPKVLKETLLSKTLLNKNGYFDVNLYVDGKPVTFLIDDFFPIYTMENSEDFEFYGFDLSDSNNIWPLLLAKAFVKFNSLFNNDKASDFISALEFMTPYPFDLLSNLKENENEIESGIRNALKKGYTVSATMVSDEKSKTFFSLIGLDSNKVYDVLDVQSIKPPSINGSFNKDENSITLFKLYNKYTDSNWIGEWSYESPLWNKYLKNQLRGLTKIDFFEFESNKNLAAPKEFWIGLDDFTKFFKNTVITMLASDLIEQNLALKFNVEQKYNFALLKVKKAQEFNFVVNQTNSNFNSESDSKKNNYLNVFLLQYHREYNTYYMIRNKFSNLGRISFSPNEGDDNTLDQGEYLIAFNYPILSENSIKQYSNKNDIQDIKQLSGFPPEVCLSVFSKNPSNITIEQIAEQNISKFSDMNLDKFWFSTIENYIESNYKENSTKIQYSNYIEADEKACKKATLLNEDDFGFGFIFYANLSDGYLNEKLTFNNLENMNAYLLFEESTGGLISNSKINKYEDCIYLPLLYSLKSDFL